MVFNKRVSTPFKNNQGSAKKGKNKFPVKKESKVNMNMSDSGSDDSSDEDPFEDSTSFRNSTNGKRVSFQMPVDKNTPAKTPTNQKKTLANIKSTPASKGKTGMQQFKGIKGKQNIVVKQEEEDDDDESSDDDEDMDDIDCDFGDEGVEEGGDDDEDDSEDDDDEEDDSEEDDDDEEEGETKAIQKKFSNSQQETKKARNEEKIPLKVKADSPKVKKEKAGAVKALTASPTKSPKTLKIQEQKAEGMDKEKNKKLNANDRKERDLRQLYVGSLPLDVTIEELKSLSSDIKIVSKPSFARRFAYLLFDSEKTAEANFKLLQNKTIRSQSIRVDFCGLKSVKQNIVNTDRLHVSGIPVSATIADVAKHFPKAYLVEFDYPVQGESSKGARVFFRKQEDAVQDKEASSNASIGGSKLQVDYFKSKKRTASKPPRKRRRSSKKAKVESDEE